MHQEFEDDLFLAPETTVSLHFSAGLDDESEQWGVDHGDALREAEREAWARHASRANGFGDDLAAFDTGNDDRPMTLREAIRLVMELP